MQQPPVGQGVLIIEASRSYSDTPHSVGILWTGDQPGEEASTCTTHNTHNRQISMPPAGFEPASERPPTHALDGAGHRDGRSTLLSQPVCTGPISPALTEGDVSCRTLPYFWSTTHHTTDYYSPDNGQEMT